MRVYLFAACSFFLEGEEQPNSNWPELKFDSYTTYTHMQNLSILAWILNLPLSLGNVTGEENMVFQHICQHKSELIAENVTVVYRW